MVRKSGKERSSTKKLITNGDIDTINASNSNFPFENILEKRTHEFKVKHQILSNEDIRHFMQPYLPLSNSINPSCSTDAYINDVKNDRFIRDKSTFYMCRLRDMPTNSNIIHPKCCCFTINTVSIVSALTTGALLILFMVYILVDHIIIASSSKKFNIWMIYFLVAISILLLIFIGLFVGGILRQRKNWMVPLISSMIFSCIGLFGTLITMMGITTDNINKGFVKYPTEEIFIVANVAIFRISLLMLLAFSILVTICYVRCYRSISLAQSEKLFSRASSKITSTKISQ